eukprot:6111366-Pleurochrysis_carterae.AAC.1
MDLIIVEFAIRAALAAIVREYRSKRACVARLPARDHSCRWDKRAILSSACSLDAEHRAGRIRICVGRTHGANACRAHASAFRDIVSDSALDVCNMCTGVKEGKIELFGAHLWREAS